MFLYEHDKMSFVESNECKRSKRICNRFRVYRAQDELSACWGEDQWQASFIDHKTQLQKYSTLEGGLFIMVHSSSIGVPTLKAGGPTSLYDGEFPPK